MKGNSTECVRAPAWVLSKKSVTCKLIYFRLTARRKEATLWLYH